jgi:nucleoside-diphosphate-sugar epimerase
MAYDLNSKDILVTGGTGFIGRRVAQALLRDGARVRVLARNPAKARDLESAGASVIAGEITDPACLERALRGTQAVIHFAGATNEFKPRAYFERVNIDGTRLLAEAALKAGVDRFVHVSTVWVYGLWAGPGTNEASPYAVSGQPYSDTKIGAEREIRRLAGEKGLPAVILQPSEVYGPGDPHWTERPLALIKAGRMVLASGGKGVTQPIFIDDLVRGVLAAAAEGRVGETYILCGPEVSTFREYFLSFARMLGKERLPSVPARLALGTAALAEGAARVSGRPPVFTRQEILATTATATYDGGKAARELGFTAGIGLAEGMRLVEAWLRSAPRPPA